jgi:hypothetical protein
MVIDGCPPQYLRHRLDRHFVDFAYLAPHSPPVVAAARQQKGSNFKYTKLLSAYLQLFFCFKNLKSYIQYS